MTRFVVRPTGPSESDGYSVVDTNREDEKCSAQIGRGLQDFTARCFAAFLNEVGLDIDTPTSQDEAILAVFAACADAHDDYLSDEEKRIAREAKEQA